MPDQFQTSDKAQIMTSEILSKWKLAKREIILAGLAIFFFLAFLVMVILFGKAQHDLNESHESSAYIGSDYCVDGGCLYTGYRILQRMNLSVDPCEDFYKFSCGNYTRLYPELPSTEPSYNLLEDLRDFNEDLIKGVVEKPIKANHDTSSERKLKHFYESCNDFFMREKLKGTPFLTKVLPELDGWKLLGTWDAATYDWQKALKKVQVDFWTTALFEIWLIYDPQDKTKRIIELRAGGTGRFMLWPWYASKGQPEERYIESYKKFIRRVAELLLRDAKEVMPADKLPSKEDQEKNINELIDDVFVMESHISRLGTFSAYEDDPYVEANKISLSDLTKETGNVIDWVDVMSYVVDDKSITGNSKFVVEQKEYFRNMTDIIRSLPDADRNRILHNYFIWRVLEQHAQELSWEYIHANREVYNFATGRQDFLGVYRYCHLFTSYYMQDALTSLYVNEFFNKDKIKNIHEITDNIKKAALAQIDKTPWMDDKTKETARFKIHSIAFSLGYPQWLENQEAVDEVYQVMKINATDYFGNLLNVYRLLHQKWNKELQKEGLHRDEWYFPAYLAYVWYRYLQNQVLVTAGILQSPVYDPEQPDYVNFGSLGSMLGRNIHHAINEGGQHYDKDGTYLNEGSWWTNSSINNYNSGNKACIQKEFWNNSKAMPSSGTNKGYAIAYTSGIRLALIAYNDWLTSKGIAEKMLPGTGLTNQQLFFVAHAQSYCVSGFPYEDYRDPMRSDERVNAAMGQLSEFSQAFQCKEGAKMNHKKKCQYY